MLVKTPNYVFTKHWGLNNIAWIIRHFCVKGHNVPNSMQKVIGLKLATSHEGQNKGHYPILTRFTKIPCWFTMRRWWPSFYTILFHHKKCHIMFKHWEVCSNTATKCYNFVFKTSNCSCLCIGSIATILLWTIQTCAWMLIWKILFF